MKKEHTPKIVFAALESYSLIGGLQQFNRRVVSCLDRLAPAEHPPVVILRGDNWRDIENREENAIYFPCGTSRIKFLLRLIFSSLSANVVFLGHINLVYIAAILRLVRPGLKIGLFVHGDEVWGDPIYRKARPFEHLFIRQLDVICSVSEFTANRMSKAFDVSLRKFRILPNAVDQISPISDCIPRAKIILTVARMAQHDIGKHHDSIIKAMPEIVRSVPDARYRVVGDGILRASLEALAKNVGVSQSVEFTGRLSDQELAHSYAEASVFVMPSEKEGFGIVFLEAWQRGLPVICGKEDASHEIIDEGVDGFSVHHDDIDDLASKIIYLLLNPDIALSMGKSGNAKVHQKYLMDNFVKNMKRVIDELSSSP